MHISSLALTEEEVVSSECGTLISELFPWLDCFLIMPSCSSCAGSLALSSEKGPGLVNLVSSTVLGRAEHNLTVFVD
jgi:hypothetical protein